MYESEYRIKIPQRSFLWILARMPKFRFEYDDYETVWCMMYDMILGLSAEMFSWLHIIYCGNVYTGTDFIFHVALKITQPERPVHVDNLKNDVIHLLYPAQSCVYIWNRVEYMIVRSMCVTNGPIQITIMITATAKRKKEVFFQSFRAITYHICHRVASVCETM